jgi:hypothetical protein
MTIMRALASVSVIALLAFAGCGGGDSKNDDNSPGSGPGTTQTTPTTPDGATPPGGTPTAEQMRKFTECLRKSGGAPTSDTSTKPADPRKVQKAFEKCRKELPNQGQPQGQ